MDFAESFTRLELAALEHQSQLERLAAQQRSLQRAHALLLSEHVNLAEEHAVLCDCLSKSSVVSEVEVEEVRRSRRRSAALRQALQAPELAAAVGFAAGLRASRQLATASRLHGDGLRRFLPTLQRQLPRILYVCGGSTGNEELSVAECLRIPGTGAPQNFHQDATLDWQPVPDVPTARRWCGAADASGMVYVFGGHNGTQYLDAAERFNAELGSWEALPPMPRPREGCAVATAGGVLYVFGGSHGERALATAEQFDPRDWSWSALRVMLYPCDACAAAADKVGRTVFVAGGRDAAHFLDAAQSLDLTTNMWSLLPPMPTARLGCAAAYSAGGFFVAGGHGHGQALAHFERFDVAGEFWERLEPMPTARLGCAAVAANGHIHVFGGHNGERALGVVEQFDVSTRRWTALPPLRNPRYAIAAAV
eukprot:CAMPEP_0117457454 /NCGR_PEP_ID=MMETSP0784-20121206/413_1 /TAXON_ID=39447 /ORGANISM="" /LENGTH=422 /DNA_ID=CAMNT_0005250921 /DNA_START=87 /DNA_END=1352 /DNA_ORIENTATION=+